MDLREKINSHDAGEAVAVLNYQPFIISDDIQTGCAYSFCSGDDPRVAPPLVFHKNDWTDEKWDFISKCNGQLRAMYDDILDEIASRFPGASLLDIGCNNGYFPVGAEIRGMRGTGTDGNGAHEKSMHFLNKALDTQAEFILGLYDSITHKLPDVGIHDVVTLSAIMCHLPDPLYFLSEVGKIAQRAILYYGQIIDTDKFLISYNPPHPNLSHIVEFPHNFNDNTRLSLGLFKEACSQMGFNNFYKIPPRDSWLEMCHGPISLTLEQELKDVSCHVAILAMR
ncbi:MAG: class I SAM-dependent methyltransferase [Defluviitaleaceae bacterium]|nr:class I SAM-dependent methyltransferase [Defluviitaleaceae bacterium]MCL2238341.1 class I SAM-dependent methyltransferase [Defluviitaleaceae bacterium]